jgi:hypothetical protein
MTNMGEGRKANSKAQHAHNHAHALSVTFYSDPAEQVIGQAHAAASAQVDQFPGLPDRAELSMNAPAVMVSRIASKAASAPGHRLRNEEVSTSAATARDGKVYTFQTARQACDGGVAVGPLQLAEPLPANMLNCPEILPTWYLTDRIDSASLVRGSDDGSRAANASALTAAYQLSFRFEPQSKALKGTNTKHTKEEWELHKETIRQYLLENDGLPLKDVCEKMARDHGFAAT